ncbi:MoaD/ThiS family protein [Microbacterium sp. LWH3-1.2]|uniref:MoaD/ThiS family protein n=1 Tax=Microbacterium sp. LWH3-1.2 TaxID=3135256 RepID=UPI0034404DB4
MNKTSIAASTVRVRFFAAAKAEVGSGEATWGIPDGTTIAQALVAAGLERSAVIARSSFLVNGLAATRDAMLRDEDELDVLPPFAGG